MEEHDEAVSFEDAAMAGGTTHEAGGAAHGPDGGERRRRPLGRPGRRGGGGLKGLLDGVLKPAAPMSREEAEQAAAREIEDAATPAMERLVLSVPGASDPDDAMARIEQSLPPRDVPSEPAPVAHLPGPELAETMVLYQVRHHLKERRFPSSHEQELAARLKARAGSASGR